MPIVFALSALASCGSPSNDDGGIPDWLRIDPPELGIEPLLGCYKNDSGQSFKLERDRLSSGDIEIPVNGFFEGRHFNYVDSQWQPFFDTSLNSMQIRNKVGYKIRVINIGDEHVLLIRDRDRAPLTFKLTDC